MQQNIERQIRERAYQLWLASGSPDGDSDSHWLAAEREIVAAFALSDQAAMPRRTAAKDVKSPGKSRRRAA